VGVILGILLLLNNHDLAITKKEKMYILVEAKLQEEKERALFKPSDGEHG